MVFASASPESRLEKDQDDAFQDIITKLEPVSGPEQGGLLLQPYDTEKGRRTMSPHTVLRAIGPEPWAVAYPATLAAAPPTALRRQFQPGPAHYSVTRC